jgi:hypothetical protein
VPADLIAHLLKPRRLVEQALQSNDGANRGSAHAIDARRASRKWQALATEFRDFHDMS